MIYVRTVWEFLGSKFITCTPIEDVELMRQEGTHLIKVSDSMECNQPLHPSDLSVPYDIIQLCIEVCGDLLVLEEWEIQNV